MQLFFFSSVHKYSFKMNEFPCKEAIPNEKTRVVFLSLKQLCDLNTENITPRRVFSIRALPTVHNHLRAKDRRGKKKK